MRIKIVKEAILMSKIHYGNIIFQLNFSKSRKNFIVFYDILKNLFKNLFVRIYDV